MDLMSAITKCFAVHSLFFRFPSEYIDYIQHGKVSVYICFWVFIFVVSFHSALLIALIFSFMAQILPAFECHHLNEFELNILNGVQSPVQKKKITVLRVIKNQFQCKYVKNFHIWHLRFIWLGQRLTACNLIHIFNKYDWNFAICLAIYGMPHAPLWKLLLHIWITRNLAWARAPQIPVGWRFWSNGLLTMNTHTRCGTSKKSINHILAFIYFWKKWCQKNLHSMTINHFKSSADDWEN